MLGRKFTIGDEPIDEHASLSANRALFTAGLTPQFHLHHWQIVSMRLRDTNGGKFLVIPRKAAAIQAVLWFVNAAAIRAHEHNLAIELQSI
jgi:hypothetical protein